VGAADAGEHRVGPPIDVPSKVNRTTRLSAMSADEGVDEPVGGVRRMEREAQQPTLGDDRTADHVEVADLAHRAVADQQQVAGVASGDQRGGGVVARQEADVPRHVDVRGATTAGSFDGGRGVDGGHQA
jgi:hypothetical protein